MSQGRKRGRRGSGQGVKPPTLGGTVQRGAPVAPGPLVPPTQGIQPVPSALAPALSMAQGMVGGARNLSPSPAITGPLLGGLTEAYQASPMLNDLSTTLADATSRRDPSSPVGLGDPTEEVDPLVSAGLNPLGLTDHRGPIPGSAIDWEGTLSDGLSRIFAATKDDTLRQATAKVRGKAKAEEEIRKWAGTLGRVPTPDEINGMIQGYYTSIMGEPDIAPPTFSKDAQEALNRAFGNTPEKKVATINDVPREQLLAIAGMGIANMLRGGSFGDVLQNVHMAVEGQQPRLDADYQNAAARADQQQKLALAQYQRITGLEDQQAKRDEDTLGYEREQAGYMARDERTAQRQHDLQMDILDRQLKAAKSQEERSAILTAMQLLPYTESERLPILGKMVEAITGKALPPDFFAPPKTGKEIIEDQQAINLQKEAQKIDEVIKGIHFKNQKDAQLYSDAIKKSGLDVQRSRKELQKLQIIVDQLPEQLRVERVAKATQAKAALMRAQAAVTAAQNGGRSKTPGYADAWKMLGTQINLLDKDYSNLQQTYSSLYSQQATAQADLTDAQRRADTLAKGHQAPDPALTEAIRKGTERLAQIEKDIKATKDKMTVRETQIANAADKAQRLAGDPAPPKGIVKP